MAGEWPLGRLVPADWRHVEKYPLRAVRQATVATVERSLLLPPFRKKYDQGTEGACVGFDWSWCQSIRNRVFYDAFWLYHQAQLVDEWPGEDYSGSSVRAGADVLRTVGHLRLRKGLHFEPSLAEGISVNRWATSVDELRTAVALGDPVALGINWYENFDRPQEHRVGNGREWWIGEGDLGRIRGGHAIALYGASDRRQAIKLVNSWGLGYPTVWMPYKTLERLLGEDGEASLSVDR